MLKHSLRQRAVALLATMALVTATVATASAAHADEGPAAPPITADSAEAQNLLEGILFATGPTAPSLGVVAEETGVPLPDGYEQIAADTVSDYLAQNATEAEEALKLIASGDVLSVEEGLDSLVADYGSWLQADAAADGTVSAAGEVAPQAAVCVWNVCVGNFALGINVAVVAFAAVWVWVVNDAAQSATTVTKQQFVVRLTDAAQV